VQVAFLETRNLQPYATLSTAHKLLGTMYVFSRELLPSGGQTVL